MVPRHVITDAITTSPLSVPLYWSNLESLDVEWEEEGWLPRTNRVGLVVQRLSDLH